MNTRQQAGRCAVRKLAAFPLLAIAIESGHDAGIERLVTLGYRVYPVHPRSSKSYRTRKQPSGTKTDQIDCWALADASAFGRRKLACADYAGAVGTTLRLLCRDEVTLIEQRTALVNQLQQALYEYYPAALEAFDDWCHRQPGPLWKFPTPQALAQAGRRRWEKFLHTHKLFHPQMNQKRLAIFAKADQFCGHEAVTAAKSALAVALVEDVAHLGTATGSLPHASLRSVSNNIPITRSSPHCPVLARRWLRDC